MKNFLAEEKPDLRRFVEEIEYWLEFLPESSQSGRHPSKLVASGFDFEDLVDFLTHPDPRRVDLIASARSPGLLPLVKIFRETVGIKVIMLADLSRSIAFGSREPKTWLIAKLAVLFAYTAYRFGDRFGFCGCDEKIIEPLNFPVRRSKTYGLEIGEAVIDFEPQKSSAAGLFEAIRILPETKSLVVLASDFHFPQKDTEALLAELTDRHQVIAFVLRDKTEEIWPDKFLGFVAFEELEKRERKTILFSKKGSRQFKKSAEEEKKALEKTFQKYDLWPTFLDEVNPEKITKALERRRT